MYESVSLLKRMSDLLDDLSPEDTVGFSNGARWIDVATVEEIRNSAYPCSSGLPIAVEGKVKPLVWEYREQQMMTYVVRDYRGVVYHINQTFGSDSYYFTTVKFDGSILYDGDDLPSAQAAAQTDHDAFILSALISSPGKDGGQEGEAVAWEFQTWNPMNRPVWGKTVSYQYPTPEMGAQKIRALVYADTRPQPASTALVEAREAFCGMAEWLLQRKATGVSKYDTNRLFAECQKQRLAIDTALAAAQSTSREGESRG